jgi:biopolymer transport protein ExbD
MDAKPNINITPLIDVLLVLLIIFMVIAPTKSTDFKARIPQPAQNIGTAHPHSLVVSLNPDSTLGLNNQNNFGTLNEPQLLVERLRQIFQARTENLVYADASEQSNNLSNEEKIQKTVFIKAPRSVDYGRVVKLIDVVKVAGANPISLQIDDLK